MDPWNVIKMYVCIVKCNLFCNNIQVLHAVLEPTNYWRNENIQTLCQYWSSGMYHHVDLQVGTNISEEHTGPKMEGVSSSKMLVSTYKSKQHYNPGD
jgi:hypothetical protein